MRNCKVLINAGTEMKFQIFQRIMRLGMGQATAYLFHEEEKEEKTEKMQRNSVMWSPS
jgi:hypothetical protein